MSPDLRADGWQWPRPPDIECGHFQDQRTNESAIAACAIVRTVSIIKRRSLEHSSWLVSAA